MSRIATQWSMVLEAHEEAVDDSVDARRALLERYSGAAYRYLRGAVGDPDVAEELAQQFAVRFLEGAFHRADPQRGRFRDYIKTALCNLVNSHFREERKGPRPFSEGGFEPATPAETDDPGPSFEQCLREELLERTWAALEQSHPSYRAALRLRIDHPEMPSRDLAEQLSVDLGKPLTAAVVRKTVERARSKFAEVLVEEMAHSAEDDSPETLRAELEQLGLLKYCGAAIERRAKRTSS